MNNNHMSKLDKLYTMIANAKELGIELGPEVYQQTDALEEEIIKKDILPVIKESIEPTLKQIQRDLTLVVDYVPGVSVRVRLSRESGLYNQEDFVDLTPDPEVEHSSHPGGKAVKRAPASSLRIIRRDGSILMEESAAATLVAAIKEADPIKVRSLGIVCCKVPLVSTSKDKKYGAHQAEVAPGLYVMKHSNNMMKEDYLNRISKAFNLGWEVELTK